MAIADVDGVTVFWLTVRARFGEANSEDLAQVEVSLVPGIV